MKYASFYDFTGNTWTKQHIKWEVINKVNENVEFIIFDRVQPIASGVRDVIKEKIYEDHNT